jgi:membrane-bound lytic murein transglycosylase F
MPITSATGTLESRSSLLPALARSVSMSVLCAILVACPRASFRAPEAVPVKDSLHEVLTRGMLRVVSRVNPATFVVDKHGPAGIEYELARDFAIGLGVELQMIPAANIGEVYAALDTGAADIAASGLSDRQIDSRPYQYGAPYLGVNQQVIYRNNGERPRSIADLVGARIMVLAQSSSADALRRAQVALPDLGWMEATRIETHDLLRKLDAGEIDYAVVKSHEFYVHAGLFPGLEAAFDLAEPEQLAWAVAPRAENRRLFLAVQDFLADREASGELDLLRERFIGYLPEVNRVALSAFAERAEQRLPRLQSTLQRIAREEGIDWRLLAAISYQESHWNPAAVSRKGAMGMMMLTSRAAHEVGVTDRADLEQSLRGGARYFQRLLARMDPAIAPADRELFALAAYNMGPSHLEDARRLARLRGSDPDSWSGVEEQLPLLAKREWREHTRHGYARGLETVSFVSRVRQYHRYLAHHDDAGEVQLAMARNSASAAAAGGS